MRIKTENRIPLYDAPLDDAKVVGEVSGNISIEGNIADKVGFYLKLKNQDRWIKWDNSFIVNSEDEKLEYKCNCDFLCSECA
jgi:hypothetical protein